MGCVDLENEFQNAVQRCCKTEEDKIEAKKYFEDCLINDLIDDALEELTGGSKSLG